MRGKGYRIIQTMMLQAKLDAMSGGTGFQKTIILDTDRRMIENVTTFNGSPATEMIPNRR